MYKRNLQYLVPEIHYAENDVFPEIKKEFSVFHMIREREVCKGKYTY